MSTTAYQTNAKPRDRRGSHGEVSDRQNRSRASSSASTKLTKTLSRTMDEVSVPRNSRPSSPAVYFYRQRTLDSKLSDPAVASSRQSAISLKSDRSAPSRLEDDKLPTPSSPTKARPHIVHNFLAESHRFDTSEPGIRSTSPPKVSKHAVAEATDTTAEEPRSQHMQPPQLSQGLGRKTQSSRSLTSMQPTVAEESEEVSSTQIAPGSAKPRMSTPTPATIAVPSARNSKSSLHEDAVTTSPRTSKSSLHDATYIPVARTSGSSLHEPLIAPTPQGTVSFMQPSLDQRLAESAERGIPVTSSPGLPAEVLVPQDFIPHAHSPLASPPLSPFIYQNMGSPPPQQLAYAQPYPYQFPQPFMTSPNFPPAFYPTPFTSPMAPFPPAGEFPRAGSAGAEDERTRLLEKVSNVLPDINRLLHYYQESRGLLSEKDSLVKQTESQRMEEVTRLRIELSACKEEYERIIGEQASENVKLKGELEEYNDKMLLLGDSSHSLTEANEDLAELKLKYESLAKEVDNLKSVNVQLGAEKKDQETELQTVKAQLLDERTERERMQTEMRQAHEKRVAEREEEHVRSLHEHKTALSKIQLDLAGMITKHTQQKKDLDFARATISEHEQSMAGKAKELTDAMHLHEAELEGSRKTAEEKTEQHKQEIAIWSQELSQSIAKHKDEVSKMRDAHQTEVERVQKAAEERLSETTTKHEQHEAQLQAELGALRSRLEKLKGDLHERHSAHDHLNTELATAREVNETLRTKHELTNKHHAELAETMLSLRNKQAEWQRESERMDEILQSLGQLGPSKGKGDEFFVSAFDRLASSVEEISTQFFQDESYPDHTLEQELQFDGLLDITGVTEAARGLRCLLVQNQIFNVLHQRIFQPFIFTSTYDSYDEYGLETSLAMVSKMISAKSFRREAIWRAITTRAIYASEYGRKAASTVATSVSREIIEKVQSMTSAEVLPALLTSVRTLSKRAVELWRQVRVEWQFVHSSMPSIPKMGHIPVDVVLWVRPHIVKEGFSPVADVEDFDTEKSPATAVCVYLQGTALRQDSPLVLARRQELLEGV